MREARFRGTAQETFAALNEADKAQVAALIGYLERDPEPDGRYKLPVNIRDENQFLIAFNDGVWRIVYHVSSEDALIIYGITHRPRR